MLLSFVDLDLTSDGGWNIAAQDADALVHTASPFPLAQPKNDDEVIRPAVDGTLRALRAARDADIGRVVLTSSIAAVMHRCTATCLPAAAPLAKTIGPNQPIPTRPPTTAQRRSPSAPPGTSCVRRRRR